MKKIIIAASLVAVALTSNAQDTYKFAAGDNNVEVGTAPFSGNPLTLPYIKYRRFLSESMAFRVGLNLTMTSKSTMTAQASNVVGALPGTMVDLTKKEGSFGWEIAPGIEKHFAGTERLSPYVGAELRVAGKSSSSKSEYVSGAGDKISEITVKNGEIDKNNAFVGNEGGFISLGLNLVAGADFYFAKRIYLGGEFGYGFGFTKFSDATLENSGLIAPAKNPDAIKQGSELGFGASLGSLSGKLKLGFLF